MDLVCTDVGRRPVGVGFERQGVCVSGDVASAANNAEEMLVIFNAERRNNNKPWIFIFEPRSADVFVLLVEDELKVLE